MMKKFILFMILASLTSLIKVPACHAANYRNLPVRVRMVLEQISRLLEDENYNKAIAVLEKFQQRCDAGGCQADNLDALGYQHPLVDFYLGNCYLHQQQYAEAAQAYGAAVTKDSNFMAAWRNLAKTYFEQQNYDDAARCFLACAEKETENQVNDRYYAAVSYALAHRYSDAVVQFNKLLEIHPAPLPLPWKEQFVRALIAAGQEWRALPYLQELVVEAQGEHQKKWREILLYQYLQLDMLAEARSYAKQLTRSDCTCPVWWKALAHIELAQKHDDEALAALTIYRYLTPLSENEKKLWADLNLQLDLPRQAAAEYLKILKGQPDEQIVQNLVVAYRHLGQDEKAFEQLERYLPALNSAGLLMLKADLLYSLERFSEAAGVYREVARVDNDQAGKAWLMAGYAAWQDDDIRSSQMAFGNAAATREQRGAALAALKQLSQLN